MKDTVHCFPVSLESPDLDRGGSDSEWRKCVAPTAGCALCEAGICQQWEDVLCADDPTCDRFVLHSTSAAKA